MCVSLQEELKALDFNGDGPHENSSNNGGSTTNQGSSLGGENSGGETENSTIQDSIQVREKD
jgi:hypothetical protein